MTETAEILDKLAAVARDEETDDKGLDILKYVRFALALHVGEPARVKAILRWLGRPEQKVGKD